MQRSSGPRRHAGECANRVGNFARGASKACSTGTCRRSTGRRRSATRSGSSSTSARRAGRRGGDERLAAPFVGKAPRGNRSESRPGPSDVEKSVRELASAVLAAGGNPFPPDLRNETLTVLVATHGAPPGTRPVNVVEFAAAAAAWGSTASRGAGWRGSRGRGSTSWGWARPSARLSACAGRAWSRCCATGAQSCSAGRDGTGARAESTLRGRAAD